MDSNQQKAYPDLTEFYRRKEAGRKVEARRRVAEKMAVVARLREFERSLADVRKANKRKRAAKQGKKSISRHANEPTINIEARTERVGL